MTEDFRNKLVAFAAAAVSRAESCKNEESTKMFLILPFIRDVLGYDTNNPIEVHPEHSADFSEKYKNKVDFAIFQKGDPTIAIECKCPGASLKDDRGQLRSYFNAALTVKLGILSDGLVWEFYADSDQPNIMDDNAFLSIDLKDTAKGKSEDSAVKGLQSLRKEQFDPVNIGAEAKRKLVFQNFVQQISALSSVPSESFTRLLLGGAGLKHVRSASLPDYQTLVKEAFSEFVNMRILERLDLPKPTPIVPQTPITEVHSISEPQKTDPSIITTETELEVFDFTLRRLAFLANDEKMFNEIEKISYKDYRGKFVVYYDKVNKGRLYDFYESNELAKKYCFVFAGSNTETVISTLGPEIDAPLLEIFKRRVAGDTTTA